MENVKFVVISGTTVMFAHFAIFKTLVYFDLGVSGFQTTVAVGLAATYAVGLVVGRLFLK